MRLPLFTLLEAARSHGAVPKNLRHSGILSLQFLQDGGYNLHYMFMRQGMTGPEVADLMVDRITKHKGPVRGQYIAEIRKKIGRRIYDSSAQVSLFENRHVMPLRSGCFDKQDTGIDATQRLFVGSNQVFGYETRLNVIPIFAAPKTPCKFCGRLTFYKEAWARRGIEYVRCNGPDCRRMAYLEHTPQSRGGIDLTPKQAKAPRSLWPTIRTANYLTLKAKERRNGNRQQQHLSR